MGEDAYICLNGDYLRNSAPSLYPNNRAFRYGELLYENIHAFATEPQFLDDHLMRLLQHMQLLDMPVPANFNAANFHGLIVKLLNKNRIFGSAAVKLTVFRNDRNSLFATDGHVSFLLETLKLESKHYKLNDKGLSVTICQEYCKQTGPLAQVRNAHTLLYLLADIEARKSGHDTVIFLNENGRLVETVRANLFLVSGNALFTPGTQQGCIAGVMRHIIIQLAAEAGYRVNDQSSLTTAALDDAEEVFLTSAVEGIRWVGAYRQKRYYNKTAKLLTAKLNELAFKGA